MSGSRLPTCDEIAKALGVSTETARQLLAARLLARPKKQRHP